MRRLWLILPLLGIAGYFAVFGGEYSLLEVRRLERQRTKEEAAVRATQREVRALRARADSLEHDSATIERLAREKYGLIRPGERLYRFAPFAPGGGDAPVTGSPAVPGGIAEEATPPGADSGATAATPAGPAARDTSHRAAAPSASRSKRPGTAVPGRKH